jgi:prepilin-type processing-associated H-X9-DG protein
MRRWVQVVIVAAMLLTVSGILLSLVQKVRESATRMETCNDMKLTALALWSYHDAQKKFPPAVFRDEQVKTLYSWRVNVFGYAVADRYFWKEFQKDLPWDDPANIRWASHDTWPYSGQIHGAPAGMTFHQVFVGPGTAFEGDGVAKADFPDGLENTLLVVEARNAVPWTKPADLTYDPNAPLPPLGPWHSEPTSFLGMATYHPAGFHIALADGHVKYLLHPYDETFMRHLVTRNGGEEIIWP